MYRDAALVMPQKAWIAYCSSPSVGLLAEDQQTLWSKCEMSSADMRLNTWSPASDAGHEALLVDVRLRALA